MTHERQTVPSSFLSGIFFRDQLGTEFEGQKGEGKWKIVRAGQVVVVIRVVVVDACGWRCITID